ncbi:hypothetical protein HXX76_011176 [Chlamydomonas incerta]|uniref:RBR-type E3 ubiquitin transferase n=1 Tax=Chlamydomonas incerta TaxID=51695 RepID=A0A835SKN5_CHLIN|nr:hypothetical protein HXX76_011176 [Chlamydomonas incerta]|eukprot:KAG2428932.1 hypothetical protein HXX76_011176 [Chlamydomonas incerta]
MAAAPSDPWLRDSLRLALGLQQQELQALQDAVLARRLQHTLRLLPAGAATGGGSEALLVEAVRRAAAAEGEDFQFLAEELDVIREQLLELALAAGDESEEELAAGAPPAAAAAASAASGAAAGRQGGATGLAAAAAAAAAAGRCAAVGGAARLARLASPAGAAAGGGGGSVAAAAAARAAAAAARVGPTVRCLRCHEDFRINEVTCAGADGAASSSSGGGAAGCSHYLCRGCLTDYVHSTLRGRTFPVPCPMRAEGCTQLLSRDAARRALLWDHPEDLRVLDRLEVEASVEPGMAVYCPHPSCSALLVRPEEGSVPADEAVECPECHHAFCLRCGITGWHTGYTCAQFQALPAHLRSASAEDAALLSMAKQQRWKRCPDCGFTVERTAGCNHMKCRCGCHFCYACGRKASGGTHACRC